MSGPVGVYGGQALKKGQDVVFMFLDGTPKAIKAGAVKATLEKKGSLIAEGLTILVKGDVTDVYFEHRTLVFQTDELYNHVK